MVFRKRPARKVRKVRKTAKKGSMVKLIKKVMHRDEETKLRIAEVMPADTYFTRGITSVSEVYSCLPPLVQSSSTANSFTRIGDQVSPTKLIIKGRVSFTYNTVLSRNITVHIYVLSAKAVRSFANYTAIPITQLLASGASTDVGFDGTNYNADLPVQRDSFTVHKHLKIPLKKGLGLSNPGLGDLSGSCITAGTTTKAFTISLKPPKTLKYGPQAATYPQNYAPFMCVGWTYNDAPTAGDEPSTIVTMNTCQAQLYFKDD